MLRYFILHEPKHPAARLIQPSPNHPRIIAYLYDLEDLERVALEGASGGLADRAAETATAWRIVDQELAAILRGPANREPLS